MSTGGKQVWDESQKDYSIEQKNRDLHEKVMKKCWHERKQPAGKLSSWYSRCNEIRVQWHENPDYLNNWNDYGELLVEIHKDGEKWDAFMDDFLLAQEYYYPDIIDVLLNPRQGSTAVWEFFVGGKVD